MSWFSDIAGRAEDLLNKVDKGAAVALQKAKDMEAAQRKARGATEHHWGQPEQPGYSETTTRSARPPQSGSAVTTVKVMRPDMSPPKLSKGKPVKQEAEEDSLLAFLNSPEPIRATTMPKTQTTEEKAPVVSSQLDIPQQELSQPANQDVPVTGASQSESENITEDSVIEETPSTSEAEGTTVEASSELEIVKESISTSPTTPASVPDHLEITLEQENDNLRRELGVARQLLRELQKQTQEEQGENRRLQRKLEHWTSQVSESDVLLRELQGRESDLKGLLSAKDSQLAILRVRLQEADQHVEALKAQVQEAQGSLEEQTSLGSLQQQTVEGLRERLRETEDSLREQQIEHARALREGQDRLSQKEEETRSLTENLVSSQKGLNQLRGQSRDLSQQLSSSRQLLEAAQQELTQYRLKAQRILHSKEKLIEALKERGGTSYGDDPMEESFHMVEPVGVDWESDREALREELGQAQALGQTLKQELAAVEHSLTLETQALEEQSQSLQERLSSEEQRRREAESEAQQSNEELRYLREDLTRTKSNLLSRIKDRETEIDKLRKQITAKSLSQQASFGSSQQRELEGRLKSLTESLIQKQTLVEALGTEKNALAMQMEVLERKLRESQGSSSKISTHVVGISTEGSSDRLPSVFRESPYDGNMARRVKRAYSAIDAFNIRLGSFLRRYPASRAFLLVYMGLLHLWVMVVLCTYQPEIHSAIEEKNRTL